jgi:hypothetical protein
MLGAQVDDEPERLGAPFKILSADLFHEPLPSLAQRSGQDLVEAQFEVHLRKARRVFGKAAQPFEAEYRTDENGRAVWAWEQIEDELTEQVLHLKRDKGLNQRQIRDALGIGLGTVNRRIKKLEDEGRLPPEDR